MNSLHDGTAPVLCLVAVPDTGDADNNVLWFFVGQSAVREPAPREGVSDILAEFERSPRRSVLESRQVRHRFTDARNGKRGGGHEMCD